MVKPASEISDKKSSSKILKIVRLATYFWSWTTHSHCKRIIKKIVKLTFTTVNCHSHPELSKKKTKIVDHSTALLTRKLKSLANCSHHVPSLVTHTEILYYPITLLLPVCRRTHAPTFPNHCGAKFHTWGLYCRPPPRYTPCFTSWQWRSVSRTITCSYRCLLRLYWINIWR